MKFHFKNRKKRQKNTNTKRSSLIFLPPCSKNSIDPHQAFDSDRLLPNLELVYIPDKNEFLFHQFQILTSHRCLIQIINYLLTQVKNHKQIIQLKSQ